jgi:hypothetical protein
MRLFSTLLVGMCILSGCASEPAASTGHTQREHEIVQTAIAFAQKSGCHLDDYRAPNLWGYDSRFGDWWVVFREKPPEHPGGDIIVSIDDSSGVPQFIPTR